MLGKRVCAAGSGGPVVWTAGSPLAKILLFSVKAMPGRAFIAPIWDLQNNFGSSLALLHDAQEIGAPHLAQVLVGQALSL